MTTGDHGEDKTQLMPSRFDFMDFLAYLLPGATALTAVATMIGLVAPTHEAISALNQMSPGSAALTILPIATALSYILGVISSTLYPEKVERVLRHGDPLGSIEPSAAQAQVVAAFESLFGDQGKWSPAHFYIARAAIGESMPAAASRAHRQASLRQLRRNLIAPVILWYLSLSWLLFLTSLAICAKAAVFLVFTILTAVLCYSLFAKGVLENRRREVREVCCALVVLAANRTSAK